MSRPSTLPIQTPSFERAAEVAPASGSAGDRARLASLAAEFESMLMLEMIKQMRRSMLDEESEGEGLGADTFSGTIDTELSRHLANGGGMGLQAELLRAWDQRATPEAGTELGALPRPYGVALPVAAPVAALVGTSSVAVPPVAVTAVSSVSRPAEAGQPEAHSDHGSELSLEIDARISSNFGWRRDPFQGRSKFHGGIDLAARYGTEVPAAAEGTVVTAAEQGAYGLTVVVKHEGGYQTRYAHLSSLDVREGEEIGKGTVLGRVGSTGRSTAPHLHFEVTQGGRRVDPDRFVRNLTGDIKGQ